MLKKNKSESISETKRIHISKAAVKSIIKDTIIFFVVFGCVLILFKMIKFPQISGSSMKPGLSDGDRVIAIVTNDVGIGDIVVVWSSSMDEYIVKRVLGVAGDHIEIHRGTLYRNGVEIYEPYIKDQAWGNKMSNFSVDIPDGYVFLLGDNRNASTDSRMIGLIPVDDIQMKVICKADWINKFK